jgi:hypothetical protein
MVSRASPIKRQARSRRTKAEMEAVRQQLYETLEADHPMTVRQAFYRMVSRPDALIAKTEGEYKQTVGRLLVQMRRAGRIPFSWIADNTRWMRKPRSYDSMADALWNTARAYRRDLWGHQEVYVEVWTEKDALAGVLLDVTAEWDVPLMVAKGFSSVTFLNSAAETIRDIDKPAYLYYFGDHDPSGVHIDRKIERELRGFAPDAEIHFRRVAVTEGQIEEWGLPTRPTKKSDSRSKTFQGDSVEVDAIPPDRLRELVENCITRHIDQYRLERLRVVETQERKTLEAYARGFADADEEGGD